MRADDAAFATWWQHVQQRAAQPPTVPRQPLRARRGGARIGSLEPALAARFTHADLPLQPDGAGHALVGEVDAALEALAHWLRREGLSNGWRDECLDVVDETGRCHGRIERAVVRPLGIATHAVHLIGRDEAGGVWVQQRAFDKPTDPGLWDTTMGGLRSHGESTADTLGRETWEEAGLRLEEQRGVTPVGACTVRRPLAHGYMVEHIESFECTLRPGQQPVNQDGEVARFECIDLPTLRLRLQREEFTLEAALVLGHWLAGARAG